VNRPVFDFRQRPELFSSLRREGGHSVVLLPMELYLHTPRPYSSESQHYAAVIDYLTNGGKYSLFVRGAVALLE